MNYFRPLTIPSDPENAVPHIIFDLSIQDVNERRQKAIRVPSARHVATKLGVDPRKVFFNRIPGTRIYSPTLNRHFAVRIDKALKQ